MDPNLPEASPAATPQPNPSLQPDHPPRRRRRWFGSVLVLVFVVLLGALAWYLVQRAKTPVAAAGGAPRPAGAGGPGGPGGGRFNAAASTVGVATAKHADIPVTIDALGTVIALANVTVQPQVSGVLVSVPYQEGQYVKKGDVLAVIDPQPFQIALQQAQGARQRDEASLEAARVTLKRYQTLLSQDSIARQTVDTQAALVQQLEGTVVVDRANENTAKLNLAWSRIVAPVSGRVGLRPVDAGNYITSNSSTNGVAVITQIEPIDVEFSVPQDRLPEIQARMVEGAKLPVTALDRTRLRQLDVGTFSTIDNLIDTTTGTIKAKARFSNAQKNLYPNQFVNARILLRTISGAVVVPVTSLRHGPNGDFVYVINEDKTVTLRLVTAGQASVDNVEITKGLAVGEQVVTEGGDRLKDGATMQTAPDRPAPPAAGTPGATRPGQGQGQGGQGRRRRQGAAGETEQGGQSPSAGQPGQPGQAAQPAAPAQPGADATNPATPAPGLPAQPGLPPVPGVGASPQTVGPAAASGAPISGTQR